MKKASGVYAIIHRESEKFYIGSAMNLGARLSAHRCHLRIGDHPNSKLQRAWNKYGADAFEFAVLHTCPAEERRAREQDAIDRLHPGYNIALYVDAPAKGLKATPETCKKISDGLKGKPKSAAHRAALSIAKTGIPLSEAAKEKLSVAFTGRVLSEVHKQRIGDAHRGRPGKKQPASQRAAQSAFMMGNTISRGLVHSEETKRRMSESRMGNTYALGTIQSAVTRGKKAMADFRNKQAMLAWVYEFQQEA